MIQVSDIKQAHSIESVVSGYTEINKYGMACCPVHGEKTPSLKVNSEQGTAHCFACGFHGDVIAVVQAVEKLEFKEALEKLGSRLTPNYQSIKPIVKKPQKQEFINEISEEQKQILYAINQRASALFAYSLTPKGKQYLYSRGLNDQSIANFQIGYASAYAVETLKQEFQSEDLIQAGLLKKDDKGVIKPVFYNRIMFPITDQEGRVCGFGGRSLKKDDKVKYINTKETPIYKKSLLLYGESHCQEKDEVFVTEGYVDAVIAHQKGINAVATCGTALSEQQIKRIEQYQNIEIAFDADEAGQNATAKALEKLPQAGVIMLPHGQDLADYLSEKQPISDFLWKQYFGQFHPGIASLHHVYTEKEYRTLSGSTAFSVSATVIRDSEKLVEAITNGHEQVIASLLRKYEYERKRASSLNHRKYRAVSYGGLQIYNMAEGVLNNITQYHQEKMKPKQQQIQELFKTFHKTLQKIEKQDFQIPTNNQPTFRSQGIMYRSNGEKYKGDNQVMLASENILGNRSNVFIGFCEARDHGWKIKKGAKASTVYYASFKFKDKKDQARYQALESLTDANSMKAKKELEKKSYFFLKKYHVFSLDQVEASLEEMRAKLKIKKDDQSMPMDIKIPTPDPEIQQRRLEHFAKKMQLVFDKNSIEISIESNQSQDYYTNMLQHVVQNDDPLTAHLTKLQIQNEYQFTDNPTYKDCLKYLNHWCSQHQNDPNAPEKFFAAFRTAEENVDMIMKNDFQVLTQEAPKEAKEVVQQPEEQATKKQPEEQVIKKQPEEQVIKKQPEEQGYQVGTFQVRENTENNRLQILTTEKPSEEERKIFKSNGFKYAPSQQAWQRQLTDNARSALQRVETQLKELEKPIVETQIKEQKLPAEEKKSQNIKKPIVLDIDDSIKTQTVIAESDKNLEPQEVKEQKTITERVKEALQERPIAAYELVQDPYVSHVLFEKVDCHDGQPKWSIKETASGIGYHQFTDYDQKPVLQQHVSMKERQRNKILVLGTEIGFMYDENYKRFIAYQNENTDQFIQSLIQKDVAVTKQTQHDQVPPQIQEKTIREQTIEAVEKTFEPIKQEFRTKEGDSRIITAYPETKTDTQNSQAESSQAESTKVTIQFTRLPEKLDQLIEQTGKMGFKYDAEKKQLVAPYSPVTQHLKEQIQESYNKQMKKLEKLEKAFEKHKKQQAQGGLEL